MASHTWAFMATLLDAPEQECHLAPPQGSAGPQPLGQSAKDRRPGPLPHTRNFHCALLSRWGQGVAGVPDCLGLVEALRKNSDGRRPGLAGSQRQVISLAGALAGAGTARSAPRVTS